MFGLAAGDQKRATHRAGVHSYTAPMPYMTCRLKEWDADPRRGEWIVRQLAGVSEKLTANQDGEVRSDEHLVRVATHDEARNAAPAMRGHDDEVTAGLRHGVKNAIGDIAIEDMADNIVNTHGSRLGGDSPQNLRGMIGTRAAVLAQEGFILELGRNVGRPRLSYMNGNDAGLKLLSQRQSRGHGFVRQLRAVRSN